MRAFVTGASGWIGSAVVPELLTHGHEVLGLARSDAAAEKVAASGAEVLRGDVQDLDALRAGAERSDGVVHLAFRHDIAFAGDFDTAVGSNQAAIETLGEALAGSDRPLAIASGVARLRPGVLATERDMPEQAAARFGFLAPFVGLDMPASNSITRDLLGWEPIGPTLVEDIEAGAYSNGSAPQRGG